VEAPGDIGEIGDHRGRRVARCGGCLSENPEGKGQQRIPGKDRNSFAVHFVGRRPSPSEVIVIHTREVVMNEAVGMEAFHGAGGWHRRRDLAAARLGSRQTKDGPEAFSSGEYAVAHRLVDRLRLPVRSGKIVIEGAIDCMRPFFEVGIERGERGGCRGGCVTVTHGNSSSRR